MTAVLSWVRRNAAVYLDNATSRRDYRAQLRGLRAMLLWGMYLLMLIGIGLLNYALTADQGIVSVVQAQDALQSFYQTVVILLAVMVSLISPALGATTVVAERERRSLDLVFSAPLRPKNFLVGKMVSAYRYTWMLLVLALPVTAVCVVLGGATWADVLVSFLLLSLNALIFSAIALLLSTLATRAVVAVIWSYAAIVVYLILTSSLSGALMFSGRGMLSGEASFLVALNPFFALQAADTFTTIGTTEVPNWIIASVFTLFVVRYLLLGAASALSPYGSPETKNLRISGLFYALAIAVMLTAAVARAAPATSPEVAVGFLSLVPQLLILLLPLICCYGIDGERKFQPDGIASLRGAIRGTPSGALAYLLMLLLMFGVGTAWGRTIASGSWADSIFWSVLMWAIGFWTFGWGLGRWSSSRTGELKAARTTHLALLLLVLGLPVPFLSLIDSAQQSYVWYLYPLYPVWSSGPEMIPLRAAMGGALAVFGLLLALNGERRLRARMRAAGVTA